MLMEYGQNNTTTTTMPTPLRHVVTTCGVDLFAFCFIWDSEIGAGIFELFDCGAGECSPTLHEGQCGIFNIHQLMSADGTPSLTSIQGTADTLMKQQDDI